MFEPYASLPTKIPQKNLHYHLVGRRGISLYLLVFKKTHNGNIKCEFQINKMKEFFLQAGMPMYTEEKQTIVNENEVNEAFEPANDLFDSLREAGDWLVDFLSDLMNQLFGNLM